MTTIELARQLGHAIQSEECYKAVTAARDAVDNDKELMETIRTFSEKRDSISEDADQATLEVLDKELGELYDSIMNHPKMKAFEEAKDEFSELMTRISAIISKSADGEDPDTAEPDHDCGGDCCTCGHCG